ncbi:unnamed protein product, partial [Polarella glacialis]
YNYRMLLDTSGLRAGQFYRLCTDVDGTGTDRSYGDSGFGVDIGLVSDISATPLQPPAGSDGRISIGMSSAEVLDILCPSECSRFTAVYLAQGVCDKSAVTGVK